MRKMTVPEIILKTRNGRELSAEEIEFIVLGYAKGEIPDYQMSAWMMAVWFRGMSEQETAHLTTVMVKSGRVVDLSAIPGIKVDKHSTGGVGDTTTLILAPLVAAAGVPVAKMSGRALGHTGGTLDKLESIPGFRIDLSENEFIDQVKRIGVAIIGQTAELAPADKKMYALRDVTATIDSVPLIAGSIMSKKIAAGTDAIVLDVKTGSGAFMSTLEEARELASRMVRIGILTGRRTVAIITDMDQPLGSLIGNSLEVREAIEILHGERKNSALRQISLLLGSYMLVLGGASGSLKAAQNRLVSLIDNGGGARKFEELIAAQGGDARVVENPDLLPKAASRKEFLSPRDGYISRINATTVGLAAMSLGAGRKMKEEVIDLSVGLILGRRTGDRVSKGEPIATLCYNDENGMVRALELLSRAFEFSEEPPKSRPLVFDRIIPEEEKGLIS